jgi:hypothetical protein
MIKSAKYWQARAHARTHTPTLCYMGSDEKGIESMAEKIGQDIK